MTPGVHRRIIVAEVKQDIYKRYPIFMKNLEHFGRKKIIDFTENLFGKAYILSIRYIQKITD